MNATLSHIVRIGYGSIVEALLGKDDMGHDWWLAWHADSSEAIWKDVSEVSGLWALVQWFTLFGISRVTKERGHLADQKLWQTASVDAFV